MLTLMRDLEKALDFLRSDICTLRSFSLINSRATTVTERNYFTFLSLRTEAELALTFTSCAGDYGGLRIW